MKTVYKYPLAIRDEQEIQMPGKPVLFKVGLDPSGELCVWAIVEPRHEPKPQRFFVIGTGHTLPAEAYNWLGTVNQGSFMWHVFTPSGSSMFANAAERDAVLARLLKG